MKYLFIYLTVSIFLILDVQGQTSCNADFENNIYPVNCNPDQMWINSFSTSEMSSLAYTADVNLYEIPIVIKIFYKSSTDTFFSDKEIFKAIELLNIAFSDRGYITGNPLSSAYHSFPYNKIRFKIANVNLQGQEQLGIIKQQVSSYQNYFYSSSPDVTNNTFNYQNYLNIHIYDTINNNLAGTWNGNFISIFKPSYFRVPNSKFCSNTLLHEIGHSLSLKHTFFNSNLSGSCVCNETDPNTQGDLIADTPPDPTPSSNTNCPSTITTTCPGFAVPLNNNLMDYSVPTNSTFTPLQIDKMQFSINNIFKYQYKLCPTPLVIYIDSIPDTLNINQNFSFSLHHEDPNSQLMNNFVNWKFYNSLGQVILNKDSVNFVYKFPQTGNYLIKITANPYSSNIIDSCTQFIYKNVYIKSLPQISSSQIINESNVCNLNRSSTKLTIRNKNLNITDVNISTTNLNVLISKVNDTIFYITDTSTNNNVTFSLPLFKFKYNNGIFYDSLNLYFSVSKSSIKIPNTSITSATLNATTGLYNCDAGVNLSISGGKVPYTYLWTGSNQCNSTSFSANTLNISNIASGWYTLQISDACNYSRTDWYWVGKAKRGRRLINADTKQQYLDEDIYFFLDANRNLNLSSNNKLGNIKLFNILGVLVYQKDNIMDNKLQIDCSNYPSGVYILSHFGENGIESTKFYKF